MKKYLFIILILILVSGVEAQEFKIIAGPIITNYSNLWPFGIIGPDSNFVKDFKTGLLAGFGIEFRLNKNIAFELDGLYFQKGIAIVEHTPISYSFKEVFNLNGFNFPLLVKINPFTGQSPYMLGGVQLSLILSHARTNLRLFPDELEWRESWKEDLIDVTKKADFGPVFGLGFEIKLSRGLLFFEGRHSIGLNNLLKHIYYSYKIRNRDLVIIIGYKI
jgi:hypothetical protein